MFIYIILWTIWTGLLCMYVCMPTCLLAKVARREIEDQWQLEWQWQPCDQLMSICSLCLCGVGISTCLTIKAARRELEHQHQLEWEWQWCDQLMSVCLSCVCLCGVFMSMCLCFARRELEHQWQLEWEWQQCDQLISVSLSLSPCVCLSVWSMYIHVSVSVCLSKRLPEGS